MYRTRDHSWGGARMRCVKETPGRAWRPPGVLPQREPPIAGGALLPRTVNAGRGNNEKVFPPKAGLTADGPCRGRRRLSIGAAGVTPPRMAPGGALGCLKLWLGGCPRINPKKWTAAGAAGRVVHRSLGVTRSTSGVRHHRRVNARGILCTAARGSVQKQEDPVPAEVRLPSGSGCWSDG